MCGINVLKSFVAQLKAGITRPDTEYNPSSEANPAIMSVMSGIEDPSLPSFINGPTIRLVDSTADASEMPEAAGLAQRRDSAVSGLDEQLSDRDKIAHAWQECRETGWKVLPGDEKIEDLPIMPRTPTLQPTENDIESIVGCEDLCSTAPDAWWCDRGNHTSATASRSSGTVPEAWWSKPGNASQSTCTLSEAWSSQSSLATQSESSKRAAVSQPQHIPVGEPVELPIHTRFSRPVGFSFGGVAAHPAMFSVQQLEPVVFPMEVRRG